MPPTSAPDPSPDRDDSPSDRYFAMLQAADPAADGIPVDLSRVRTAVLSRLGRSPDATRPKVWEVPFRLLPVGAAACVAVAVGAGTVGYTAGNANVPVPPPIVATLPGPNGADAAADMSRDMAPSMWGWFGRTVYVADWVDGTPNFPTDAEAFTYVAPDRGQARDYLDTLADLFGVDGEPQRTGDAWSLVSSDGMWNISVGGDALGSFYVHDSSAWMSCAVATPEPAPDTMPAPDTTDGGPSAVSPPSPGCSEPPVTASKRDARAAAENIVSRLGFDPQTYTWDVQGGDGTPVQVNAYPAGTTTAGYASVWSFTFYNDDRPTYANGYLASLTSIGAYPLVNVTAAVDRLNDPRFGPMFGGAMPMMARSDGDVPAADSAVAGDVSSSRGAGVSSDVSVPYEPTVPRPVSPGEPVWWPTSTQTLTAASLQLVQHWQADGAVMAVPAYRFTTADGGEVWVLAVADTALNTSSDDAPVSSTVGR